MTYYKITKAEADLIGRFEYDTNRAIDPYVNEQKDGTYLVSETMYNILKDHPKIKQVNFSVKTPIEKEALDTKPTVKL